MVEARVCGADDIADATSASLSHAQSLLTKSGSAHEESEGAGICVHGHCHHASVAAPTDITMINYAAISSAAEQPRAVVELISANLARATPPPRA